MDFIDKMRQASEEAAKKPRQLEPWEIERQREEEDTQRKKAIGKQYLTESGCYTYCAKLKKFLNSQDPTVRAFYAEEGNYIGKDGALSLEFYWHPKGVQHDFKVVAKVDGTLVFTGRRWPYKVTCAVTLNEWRTNGQTIDSAFEMVYHDPEVWDQEYSNSFRV